MEIDDKYFYAEEIPHMLAEIRGACSRVAFWAREAGERDKAKFGKWEAVTKEYNHQRWPQERFMENLTTAQATLRSLKEVLDTVEAEEAIYRQGIDKQA